jgi:hypothetical protein
VTVERDRDIQMELVTFGKEVEYFLENDRIGKYLLECAILDMSEAAEELAAVDAHDVAKVHGLQIKFRVASQVRQWLGQAVQRGMEARTIIEQEEDGAS